MSDSASASRRGIRVVEVTDRVVVLNTWEQDD